MRKFKPPFVLNGPLLELKEGHVSESMEINGLDFEISFISAPDVPVAAVSRKMQAERLVLTDLEPP